jgi:hypothetical protein
MITFNYFLVGDNVFIDNKKSVMTPLNLKINLSNLSKTLIKVVCAYGE